MSVREAVTFGIFVDMTMILVMNAVNKLIIVAMNVLFILFLKYLTIELIEGIWLSIQGRISYVAYVDIKISIQITK